MSHFQKRIKDIEKGAVDADTAMANVWRDQMEDLSLEIGRKYSKVAGNKISAFDAQQKVLKEMNDVLMSGKDNGQLLNERSFSLVDEIARDPTTGFTFKNGRGVLKDVSPLDPLPREVMIPDPKTGKEIMESVKVIDPATGKPKQLYNVTLNDMDPKKVEAFGKKLIDEYKATPKQVTDLFNTFTKGRDVIWRNVYQYW